MSSGGSGESAQTRPEPLLLADAITRANLWTGSYELSISSPSKSVISLLIMIGNADDK